MGREGGDASVGITVEMRKLIARMLRHRLNLQSQDTELVEYGLHTIGEHPQVLSTTEHLCLGEDLRQTTDGMMSPEEVMTLVEEIVVKAHVGILLFPTQGIIYRFLISPNTWVIHL